MTTATRTRKPRPTEPAANVRSHTGKVVHRGKWVPAPHTERGWIEAQACGNARRAVAYGYPTPEPVTCKRCL